MPENNPELFTLPADLTLLSDEQVDETRRQARAEFDRVDAEPVTPELVNYQAQLVRDLDAIESEAAGRRARAVEAETRRQAQLTVDRDRMRATVHPEQGDPPPSGGDGGSTLDVGAVAEAAAKGTVAALVSVLGPGIKRSFGDMANLQVRATSSLTAASQHVPTPPAADRKFAMTAGIEIRDRQGRAGAQMDSLNDLVYAAQTTAKQLPATRDGSGRRVLIASMPNRFEHEVDERTRPGEIDALMQHLREPRNLEALVAGGGWCAPSQYRYDFFNIACADGLVDLPTVGITRGGLQVPVSPSLADTTYMVGGAAAGLAPFGATFSNASVPWLWTETDDIATVTGSPNKPTVRVPCPTFTPYRLECYGLTLTAGNLTDDAYPEATANTLRLLMAAAQHAKNARIIAQMVALSTAAITISGGANRPAFNQIVSGIDLAATDYRAKFGMCDEEILEVVLPFWIKDVLRADLAWRTNVQFTDVSEGQLSGWLADRALRPQWVNDWQVRGAGQFGNPAALPGAAMTAWPQSADVLLYAAGTFLLGNGLNLDLGVVRDSVLNAENDFTAAWQEECHLVARVGHESRRYNINWSVNGALPAAVAAGHYI